MRITLLVAPPRSVSTGIAIALSQSPDVDLYIHEPFANDYSGVPSATVGAKLIDDILKKYKRTRKITPESPVNIVIKEASTHLRPLHFHYLSQYSKAIIVLVRSPLLQVSSIARICKWVWADSPRRFRFDIRRLKKKDLRKYEKNGDLETYFVNSWRDTASQVAYLDTDWPGNIYDSFNWFGIDAEVVRSNPKETLKLISKRAGIRFTNQMISGWRKDHLFNIGNDEWSKKALNTNCLYQPNRSCPNIEDIPESWLGMIKQAVCNYAQIWYNSNFLKPYSLSTFKTLCSDFISSRRTLVDVAPDTCYVLAGAFSPSNRKACRLRADIRSRYPQFKTIFDFLDQIPPASNTYQKHLTFNRRNTKRLLDAYVSIY